MYSGEDWAWLEELPVWPEHVCVLGEGEVVSGGEEKEPVPEREVVAVDLGACGLIPQGAERSGERAVGEKPILSDVSSTYYIASWALTLKYLTS